MARSLRELPANKKASIRRLLCVCAGIKARLKR
jgi:hypothetical protein